MASQATQLNDKFLVETAFSHDDYLKVSTDKQVVQCNDNNQGSYTNGMVTIDTTNQLGGNTGFAAIKEGYVVVPYLVTLKNADATRTVGAYPCNAQSVIMKGNVGNILDRVDISIGGTSIVAGQSFSNLWNNTRLLFDTSVDANSKNGGTSLMYPDTGIPTWSAASANGDGYSSNQINPILPPSYDAAASGYAYNSGAQKRSLEATPLALAGATAAAGAKTNNWPSQLTATVQQNCINNGKSYFQATTNNATGAVASTLGRWVYMIKLKLTDIHPVFDTLDLTKNPQIRLVLYFNTGSVNISVGSTTVPLFSLASTSMTGGNTVPIMFTSGAVTGTTGGVGGNPNALFLAQNITTTTPQIQIAFGPVNNSIENGGSALPFTTTRLYLPMYNLVPEIERQIISNPVKKFVYNDVYIQPFVSASATITAGQQFNLTVQSTFSNIQYVAVLPYTSQTIAAAGTNFLAVTGAFQGQSPFYGAPLQTAPGSGAYNMQCTIGSTPLYRTLMSYDYQHFLDELTHIFGVNGGDSRSFGNGLINQIDWTNTYKTWLFDCSRLSSDVSQNVSITGNYQSDQALDFYVVIVRRRSGDQNRITCEVLNLRG